jgi:hypothetical protein
VRCGVNVTGRRLRFYGLGRHRPDCQPLLLDLPYHRPQKPFRGQP